MVLGLALALSRCAGRRHRLSETSTLSSFFNNEWMRAHGDRAGIHRYFTGIAQTAFEWQLRDWRRAQLSAFGMASVNGAMMASNRSPLAVTIW